LSGGADSKDRIFLARPDSIYRACRAVGRVWLTSMSSTVRVLHPLLTRGRSTFVADRPLRNDSDRVAAQPRGSRWPSRGTRPIQAARLSFKRIASSSG
jgi:hypothetical protein